MLLFIFLSDKERHDFHWSQNSSCDPSHMGKLLFLLGPRGLWNAPLHSTLRESPADRMTAHASQPPPPSSDRQLSSAASAQLNDHIPARVTVEKIFLFIPHDVTLKTILKNLTKPKPYCRHHSPAKTQTNQCAACHFVPGTGFIILGTVRDFCQTC